MQKEREESKKEIEKVNQEVGRMKVTFAVQQKVVTRTEKKLKRLNANADKRLREYKAEAKKLRLEYKADADKRRKEDKEEIKRRDK